MILKEDELKIVNTHFRKILDAEGMYTGFSNKDQSITFVKCLNIDTEYDFKETVTGAETSECLLRNFDMYAERPRIHEAMISLNEKIDLTDTLSLLLTNPDVRVLLRGNYILVGVYDDLGYDGQDTNVYGIVIVNAGDIPKDN